MLSPAASNAPDWNETHPAAWNVPVDGESLAVRGAGTRGRTLRRAVCTRRGRTRSLRCVLDDVLSDVRGSLPVPESLGHLTRDSLVGFR